jgi:hypothetical protein
VTFLVGDVRIRRVVRDDLQEFDDMIYGLPCRCCQYVKDGSTYKASV